MTTDLEDTHDEPQEKPKSKPSLPITTSAEQKVIALREKTKIAYIDAANLRSSRDVGRNGAVMEIEAAMRHYLDALEILDRMANEMRGKA